MSHRALSSYCLGSGLSASNHAVESWRGEQGPRKRQLSPAAQRTHALVWGLGSLTLHLSLLAKPRHPLSSKTDQFTIKPALLPFPRAPVATQQRRTRLPENRGHLTSDYLNFSIANMQGRKCIAPLASPAFPPPGNPSCTKTSQNLQPQLLTLNSPEEFSSTAHPPLLFRGMGNPLYSLPHRLLVTLTAWANLCQEVKLGIL